MSNFPLQIGDMVTRNRMKDAGFEAESCIYMRECPVKDVPIDIKNVGITLEETKYEVARQAGANPFQGPDPIKFGPNGNTDIWVVVLGGCPCYHFKKDCLWCVALSR